MPSWLYPIFSHTSELQQQEDTDVLLSPYKRIYCGPNSPYPRQCFVFLPFEFNWRGNHVCWHNIHRLWLFLQLGGYIHRICKVSTEAKWRQEPSRLPRASRLVWCVYEQYSVEVWWALLCSYYWQSGSMMPLLFVLGADCMCIKSSVDLAKNQLLSRPFRLNNIFC